jgi:hypothetical protein
MANSNRDKGHAYERKIMNELKHLFPDVKTSRNESKLLDDLKVDLAFTDPYCIQCKATERTAPYGMILKDIQKAFPKKIPVILHKRNYQMEVAVISKYDFFLILQKLQEFEKYKEDYQDIINHYLNEEK